MPEYEPLKNLESDRRGMKAVDRFWLRYRGATIRREREALNTRNTVANNDKTAVLGSGTFLIWTPQAFLPPFQLP